MWASGSSGGPYIADDLALLDTAATTDAACEAIQMGIGGFVSAIMADADIFAVTTIAAGCLDGAVPRCVDRRAARRGKVDASMHLIVTKDRMAPAAKA